MVKKLELLRLDWTKVILSISTIGAFIISYLTDIYVANVTEYIAVIAVILLDGFFGMIAGFKREGFQTFKALNILKTIIIWVLFLSVVLTIEIAIPEMSWLSTTVLAPFLIFELISALKNAHLAGFVNTKLFNSLLSHVDKHKDFPLKESNDSNNVIKDKK